MLNVQSYIRTDLCLLVFDAHEDLDWLRRIFEREATRVSHVVLGGDYFDTFRDDLPPPEKMCKFLLEQRTALGERLTILVGNHDIAYLEAAHTLGDNSTIPHPCHWCSGYSAEKAAVIANQLEPTFWRECRLFVVVNGCLISHAGVAKAFWPEAKTIRESVTKLNRRCKAEMASAHLRPCELLSAGVARYGGQAIGGLTWLDWHVEFADDLPLPQIVGHTTSRVGARRKGRSWCLDGMQSCYGLLHRDGRLEVIPKP